MNSDLLDLLLGWLGHDLDPARRDELLEKLESDPALRASFVAEIRMLGMLKVVHSGEPHWLTLEDEIGWTSQEQVDGHTITLEERVISQLEEVAPRKPTRRRWIAASASIAALLVLGTGLFVLRPAKQAELVAQPAGPTGQAERKVASGADSKVDRAAPITSAPSIRIQSLAVVVKLEGVAWDPVGEQPGEGDTLSQCRLKFDSGRAVLSMLSGVMLSIEGPADFELVSMSHVYCHGGKLHAHVPEGAEGFLVSGPGSAVLDLGTEFGLNFKSDGKSTGKVFKGEIEVALLSPAGIMRRSQTMKEGSKAFEIDPDSGNIEDLTQPEPFISPMRIAPPLLLIPPGYVESIRRSGPRSYWRMETLAEGSTPNEIEGGPRLIAKGAVTLGAGSSGNHCAVFPPDQDDQLLRMDGLWQPSLDTGYAIELWFMPEAIGHAVLAAMPVGADSLHHLVLLELTSQNRRSLHRPGSVRFMHRWPLSRHGGDNLFSQFHYVPYRWHHLVAQVRDRRMEVFVDGSLEGSTTLRKTAATAPANFLLGRLSTVTENPLHHTGWRRGLTGRIDEVALYDRFLSADEIQKHYRAAVEATPDP